MKLFIFNFFIFFSLASFSQSYRLIEQDLPILEIGAGIGWAHLPYYPGGKEKRDFILPFPSFVYRGDVLRADEDGGLRGRFFSDQHWEVNTSIGFNLPGDSDEIEARRGMEDLDPLFEAGPGIIYHFIPKKKGERFALSVNLGLRGAFSSDFKHTQARGLVFNPLLFSWFRITQDFTLFNGLSGTWATRDYHGYFYDVEAKDVTSARSQYRAKSGQISTNLSNFFIYNYGSKWSFVLGFIYEDFKNAANRNSPLLKVENSLSTIVGFNYWFYQSEETTKGLGAF